MKSELKPNVVGIDIGGTNTVFGIVDANGNVLASNSIKTQAYPELEDYIEALGNGLLELISKNGGAEKINGIGVGAPNANYYTGNIEHAANLPWKGIVPFAKMLSDKVGLPVSLTNDANAAAIGEMKYGAARGMRDFIMITLGTGVGSGVVANGQLIYGHDGNAGELGHVIVRRDGRPCGCGNKGCLETYTSATGVARTAKEFLLNRKEDSLLRKIDLDKITSKDVFDAAMAGDQIAKDIFAFTGQILGEALADFVKFSSPEAFVLFGGLAKAGDLLFNPVKKAMDDNLMPVFKGKVKVLFSQMKDADAAVLGASALAWDI
ncbi:MAG: ROK family protein [Paludibacteraceae bacterium]|nr:ROK family protein [Paludibacteraceae bacterium]MBP5482536.1 ROK family protein [Paludibacteraceae bacterium]